MRPSDLFGGVTLPPVVTLSPADHEVYRLFLPFGRTMLPPLRDQLQTLTTLTADAVRAAANEFEVGPLVWPPVTLVSAAATVNGVPGVVAYMFSMIARDVSGDPFAVRSGVHATLNDTWNHAARLDIASALRGLHSACTALEAQDPMLAADASDLVVVGGHVVSILDTLVGLAAKH